MQNTQDKIDTFFKQFPTSTFPKNQVLMSAGEMVHAFYFVETGAVKMTRTTELGKNLILHLFFPKSFFSLLSLASDNTNYYDFVTLLPTTVRKVPRAELITFLQTNNDVLYDVHIRLLKGMTGLLKRIEQTSVNPAEMQVSSLLVYFATHFSEAETVSNEKVRHLKVKITHQEIADWLGLSRENVSLQMEALEKANLIKVKDRYLEIQDFEKLQNVSY